MEKNEKKLNRKFVLNLMLIMAHKDITIKDMAEANVLTSERLCEILSEKEQPLISEVNRIASYLEVSMENLVC